jgi:hypothetical protein
MKRSVVSLICICGFFFNKDVLAQQSGNSAYGYNATEDKEGT